MLSQDIHNTIDSDNQVVDDPSETHVMEDIDINGGTVSEAECDEVNSIDRSLECDEDESNDASIIGKVFNTHRDAYTIYNRYAFLHGFGIRIHWAYKNKKTKEAYRKLYVCNKQGFKRLKGEKKRRRELRTGCEAMLRISKRKDGKWFVDIFSGKHNHELSLTPAKVMKHRSHGKFHRSMACKTLMVQLGQSGLKPSQIKKAVNAIKSLYEADVTSKQCVDILSEERKQYKDKEFYGLIKHFQDKAFADNNQYFSYDLFEDGSPKNVFWADGRSRDAYTEFGV